MRKLKRIEMIQVMLAVADAKQRLREAPSEMQRSLIIERLYTLYACIPVDSIVDFLSEAGTNQKGAA